MIHYGRRQKILAVCLSGLAGFVDALGFLKLGGFFVSFMSGNTTRLGVGLAAGNSAAPIAGVLVACFVLGVVVASFTAHAAGQRRRTAVLALVSALLTLAATLDFVGQPHLAIAAMTLAMGAENGVFERNGEVSVGVTYMTGTLVKFGQRLAEALLGGARFAWAPYLLLWMGLALGAVAGAALYPHLGLQALWIAALAAAVLTLFTAADKQT